LHAGIRKEGKGCLGVSRSNLPICRVELRWRKEKREGEEEEEQEFALSNLLFNHLLHREKKGRRGGRKKDVESAFRAR